jgi:hypothetical protein
MLSVYLNPLLTPREWYIQALLECTQLIDTPEYKAKSVEAKRYKMLGEEIERLRILCDYFENQTRGSAEQVQWLLNVLEKQRKGNDESGV